MIRKLVLKFSFSVQVCLLKHYSETGRHVVIFTGFGMERVFWSICSLNITLTLVINFKITHNLRIFERKKPHTVILENRTGHRTYLPGTTFTKCYLLTCMEYVLLYTFMWRSLLKYFIRIYTNVDYLSVFAVILRKHLGSP